MKLLTKEILDQFKKIWSHENDNDPIVIAKFFNPTGIGTWYATEYDATEGIFFGYVSLFGNECDEWGSFALAELEEFKGKMGLGIERDLHCGQKRISEYKIPSLAK